MEHIAPVEGCRVPELRWEPTSFYVQTSDSARCFGDTNQIMLLKLQCEGLSEVDRWSAEGGSPLQFYFSSAIFQSRQYGTVMWATTQCIMGCPF